MTRVYESYVTSKTLSGHLNGALLRLQLEALSRIAADGDGSTTVG